MKIINASRGDCKPLDRNQFLDLEIQRLEEEIGVNERIQPMLPNYLKRQYLKLMENFASTEHALKDIQEETQLQQILKDRQFTCFNSLPTELRLRIWEFAFASHIQPRIHCVDMSKSNSDRECTFISNHPVSAILHTNHESRSHYLLKTQLTFAFETYINFDTDIVYIPDFADRELHFRKFLDFEDSQKIQKLALRKNFFCDIPLPGHFSSSQLEMMDCLWDWNQMIIIFEDERSGEEIWKDTTVVFREFSAREKRKKAERNYVRKYSRVLNGMLEGIEEETMDFRFGRIERSTGQGFSIGALCSSRDEDMEDME